MRRFRFELARLERLRETEKRAFGVKLSAALAAAEAAARQVEIASRAADFAAGGWRELGGVEAPEEWRARAEQLESALRRAERARVAEAEARSELAVCRDEYLERARAHRVLERLRQKRFERWLEDARREEQSRLEEAHRLRGRVERASEEER